VNRAVTLLIVGAFLPTPLGAQSKTDKFIVAVRVDAAPQAVSPEGFVDGSDVWLRDSVADLRKALNGKEFTPNKTCPGARARYVVVDNPEEADIGLTVGARGTSSVTLGQRTTAEFYRGVVLSETVPTVGVTRWVSIVLSVATYRKEFVAWSTNQSRFSLGAWRKDTNLLARVAACWVMNNEAQIRERRKAK